MVKEITGRYGIVSVLGHVINKQGEDVENILGYKNCPVFAENTHSISDIRRDFFDANNYDFNVGCYLSSIGVWEFVGQSSDSPVFHKFVTDNMLNSDVLFDFLKREKIESATQRQSVILEQSKKLLLQKFLEARGVECAYRDINNLSRFVRGKIEGQERLIDEKDYDLLFKIDTTPGRSLVSIIAEYKEKLQKVEDFVSKTTQQFSKQTETKAEQPNQEKVKQQSKQEEYKKVEKQEPISKTEQQLKQDLVEKEAQNFTKQETKKTEYSTVNEPIILSTTKIEKVKVEEECTQIEPISAHSKKISYLKQQLKNINNNFQEKASILNKIEQTKQEKYKEKGIERIQQEASNDLKKIKLSDINVNFSDGGIEGFVNYFKDESGKVDKVAIKEYLLSFVKQIKEYGEQVDESYKKFAELMETKQGQNKLGQEKTGIDSFVSLLVNAKSHENGNYLSK